jgi:hypothetical protein
MPSISDDRRLLQELYLPPTDDFVLLDVPEMRFLMVDGNGNHDSEAFALGTRWLISAIGPIRPKAKERMGNRYVEPPLEVLWWADDMSDFIAGKRDKFKWRQMIVMADWIDDEMIDHAIASASRRVGEPPSSLRLEPFAEGTCAQIMRSAPRTTRSRRWTVCTTSSFQSINSSLGAPSTRSTCRIRSVWRPRG